MLKTLEEIRKYEDFKHNEVADALNVKRSTYTGWESGKDIIPFKRLYEIANFFDVSIDYLIGKETEITKFHSEKNIDRKLIGQNIKKFRKKKHISQKSLGDITNVSQATISNYEKGKTLITTEYILEFSKKYDYSIDKLVGRK